jgi:beta-mannosidase
MPPWRGSTGATGRDMGTVDLLSGARWECAATTPGAADGPDGLTGSLWWWPATVPGTAAGALADAGIADAAEVEYDTQDWWFRCRFEAPGRHSCRLRLGGLATVADAWLNGRHLLHSENMFRSHHLATTVEPGRNELVVRCAALAPLLEQRRPRPRWKTNLVRHQNLRWFRTSLLGRIPGWTVVPAPVGPWRPVSLVIDDGPALLERQLQASCEGDGGRVVAVARLVGVGGGATATLRVGPASAPVELHHPKDAPNGSGGGADEPGGDGRAVAVGQVHLDRVERWWPHTHGAPVTYPVTLEIGRRILPLGSVGFRTVTVDRSDGGFQLFVNQVPVFARGACWMPPDPVRLTVGQQRRDHLLELARAANMNMLRVPGTTVYEEDGFLQGCDRLGILVWHDCMVAFTDPPEDEAFVSNVTEELRQQFTAMSGHPSLAVVCGSQEVEEVAAMSGLPPARWAVPLTDKTVPSLMEHLLPDVVYVTSNPTGGDLPFRMDTGVSQYFGVGGYLRPLEDARLAGVRFAAECLALAIPPEPATVEEMGGAYLAGHDPGWKRAVHHDAGRSWDMEDVREHYQRVLFDVDPLAARYLDAERALELGRATCAELVRRVFAEWRRHGSTCAGGLVIALNDLRLGAGWGLVDSRGRPKAPWYALRRASAPVTVLVTDEGLNGLRAHVTNDTDRVLSATLEVTLFTRGELMVDQGSLAIEVPARSVVAVDTEGLLEGFRDIGYAYHFAPPAHDVVAVRLVADDGSQLAEEVHLPTGQARPLEPDVGLEATARSNAGGTWTVEVRTRRLAQWVALEVPGFLPLDSWFHLLPGAARTLSLVPDPGVEGDPTDRRVPRGKVRALNSLTTARLVVAG